MSDVFISYAREDKEYVQALHRALADLNRDTWVDWEDIPKTAEWLNEVHAGIEAAHTFVFVISPDSVRSPVCDSELSHAVALNKRIVPLVRREVDPATIPLAVGRLNWIFSRENDDFDAAVQSLVSALDTDLDWVRVHTRLLIRATEWNQRNHPGSLLLRSTDLKDAEGWLGRGGKAPAPTALHTQYIIAGRRAATRRQRLTLVVVTAGLVMTTGLAILAWLQRNEARSQASIALARQLAAQAEVTRSERHNLLERSVLLAVESMRRVPSLEADQVLRQSVPLLAPLLTVTDESPSVVEGKVASPAGEQEGDGLVAVAFSPTGKQFATAGTGRMARVWDSTNGRLIKELAHDGRVAAVAFGGGGTTLLTASVDKRVRVWDLLSGQAVVTLAHDRPVRIAKVSRNGTYLATAEDGGTIRLWDGRRYQLLRIIRHGEDLYDLAFSSDGTYVAAAGGDSVRVWHTATGRLSAHLRHEGAYSLTFSRDSTRLATTSLTVAEGWKQSVVLWAWPGGRRLAEMTHGNRVWRAAFSPDGRLLASASGDQTAGLWLTADGRPMAGAPLVHQGEVYSVEFSPDGKYLATTSADNTARIFASETGQEVSRMVHGARVSEALFSPDGMSLITLSDDNIARVWDVSGTRRRASLIHRGDVNAVLLEAGGRLIARASRSNPAWVPFSVTSASIPSEAETRAVAYMPSGDYVLTTGELATEDPWSWETTKDFDERQLPQTEARFLTVIGPYGLYPASSSEQRAQLHQAPQGPRDVARFADPGHTTGQVVFSPDGGTTAVRGSILFEMDEALVQVWDNVTGREIARLPHEANVTSLAFSPDGRRLLTASEDRIVRVWDMVSRRTITTLAHDKPVYWLAFDATALKLATVSGVTSLGADETQTHMARVWDMDTGQARVRFAIEGPVHDLAFSPDGLHLTTVSKDGTTRVWETSSGREVARIRESAVATAQFSADGRWLATLSVPDAGGPVLRLWRWRPGDLIDFACAGVTRNLSLEEWQQYIGAESPRRTCPALPAPR